MRAFLYPVLNILAGGTTVLAFAPWSWYPLVFFIPALTLFLWSQTAPRRAFWHGYLFGYVYSLGSVYWIYYSLHDYGGASPIFSVTAVLLMAAVIGLYYAALAYLTAFAARRSGIWRLSLLLCPAAWVLAEWLRSVTPFGLPWNLLGQALIDSPFSPLLAVTGVYGASFLAVFCAGTIVCFFCCRNIYARLFAVIGAIILLAGSAAAKLADWTEPVSSPVRFALIQSNTDQKIKFSRERYEDIVALYKSETLRQSERRLIIWPETALPAPVGALERRLFPTLRKALRQTDSDLLAGVFYRSDDGRYHNSLMNVTGGDIYHKRRLVPFGEYIPLRGIFNLFDRFVHMPMSDLKSSQNAPLIEVADHAVGASICYESVFGHAMRDALPEARYLVNISNDSWFGRSYAPHQLLQITRLRAAEAGRNLLRATSTGISALIDMDGRVISRTELFKQQTLTGEIQPRRGATPYSRWGDWPVIGFVSLLALSFFVSAGKTR